MSDKWGIINERGKEITSMKYDQIGNYSNPMIDEDINIIIVGNNNKFGLIDYKGKEILPLKYSDIRIDHENKNQIIVETEIKKEIFFWNGIKLQKIK